LSASTIWSATGARPRIPMIPHMRKPPLRVLPISRPV
jgi:hypothetical protein